MLLNTPSSWAQMPAKERTLNEEFRAKRIQNGGYKLILPTKKQELYIGESSENIEYSKPLQVSGDTIIEASPSERLFFAVVADNDTTIISERKLPLTGTTNFRDLGGIRTTAGRHVKWGEFFRADDLSGLQSDDFPYLLTSGITDVYDLRTEEEIALKKDHLPQSINWIHYPIFEEGNSLQMRAVMQQFETDTFTPETANELLVIANREFVQKNTATFSNLIKQILDRSTPSLFHCTAGKDRTGFTAAMILSILGVDRQTVINEYLMTNYYTHDKLSNDLESIITAFGGKIKPEVMIPLMTVNRSYIEAALQEIDNTYGDMNTYIREGLNISDEQRAHYIASYTY